MGKKWVTCCFAILLSAPLLAAVPALGEGEDFSNQLFVPIVSGIQLPGDAQLLTAITILNTSSGSAVAAAATTFLPEIHFFDDQGAPVAVEDVICGGDAPSSALGPGQVRRYQTRAGNFGGWARITWTGALKPQVDAEVVLAEGVGDGCDIPFDEIDSRHLPLEVRARASQASQNSTLPAVITNAREVAVSMVNPSTTQSAQITLQALRDDGTFLDVNEFTIGPGERVSDLLFNLLIRGKVFIQPPTRPVDFRGQLRVLSDVPVAVGAIDVFFPDGRWGHVPVVTLP